MIMVEPSERGGKEILWEGPAPRTRDGTMRRSVVLGIVSLLATTAAAVPFPQCVQARYQDRALVLIADSGTDIVRLPAKPQVVSPPAANGDADGIQTRLEKDVVHVKLSIFSERTHATLVRHIDYLKKTDMPIKGYIVDLRDNPGGLLNEAIAVADDFLEKGAILMVKARVPEESERYNARPGDVTGGKPVVIIINHGAAAEAEVVAAALQDHYRATVIGTRSLGKGSVKTFNANGPTTVEYYTPSGRSIQAKGIYPNVVVERQPPTANEPEIDSQLQYALNLLRGAPLPPTTRQ